MTKRIKRYISAFLAAAVLCTSSPILPAEPCEHSAGIAVSAEESGSEYEFDATTGTITKYNGAGGNITIPSVIDGVAVTAIGNNAFMRNTSVTGVVIPEGVTSVGGYAFFNCVNITTLSLPTTLTFMDELAFKGCSSLTEVTIPANVTNFGNQAFSGCTSLRKVTISEGVTALGEVAFFKCSSLTDVTLPKTLTSVSGTAFAGCTSLTEIVIPEGVTAIDEQAFDGCNNLRSVTLPSTLTTIGKKAFISCTSLTNITIPENVTLIDGMAFENCSGLDSIVYPKNTEVKGYEIPQDTLDRFNQLLNNPSYSDAQKKEFQKELDKLLEKQKEPPLPKTTTQIKYEVINGEVTITEIILPEGKTAANIPAEIGGKPVTKVAEDFRDKVSESGHTHKLTRIERKEPTCTVDGNTEYWTCSLCGKNFSDENAVNEINETDTVSPAPGHDYSEEWSGNDDKHWHKCTRCESTSDEDSHTGTAGCEDKAVCTVCGREYGEPLGHSYVDGICERCQAIDPDHTHRGGSATCTQKAVCTVCGQVYGELGQHSFRNGICTVCGATDPDYTQPSEPIVTEPTVSDTTTDTSSETSSDTSSETSSETEPPFSDTSSDTSSETEPPVTGSDVTDPSVTEPPVTDSSGTEPTVTVPSVTQPSETAPTVTAPPVTEPSVTMPTATNPPIIYPPYTPTAPAVPTAPTTPAAATDTNNKSAADPYIQGDSGKSGWAAISDIISDTPDGGTVTVDMNNSNMLPKDIVSQIKGRDIDLVLVMKNKFVWTINGTDVTNAKTVNMRVQRSVNISASTVEEYFGDTETVQIQLAHNGDFGFTAKLSVSLGSRYNGMTASSYCYKAGKFSFGDSAEIADGSAKLKFSHASNWLIAITDAAAEDVSADAAISAKGDPVGSCRSVSLLFLTVIPIIGTAFICIKRSKQK